jgi:DNA-binding transcriptional ArsR family regulator
MPTLEVPAAVPVAAKLFRGLGDPTRLAILLTLIDGERRVTDVVDAVKSSQSNVSGHLACLKECGLVADRAGERRQVFYRIARPEVVSLLKAAERLVAETGTAIDLCHNPLMVPETDRPTVTRSRRRRA